MALGTPRSELQGQEPPAGSLMGILVLMWGPAAGGEQEREKRCLIHQGQLLLEHS